MKPPGAPQVPRSRVVRGLAAVPGRSVAQDEIARKNAVQRPELPKGAAGSGKGGLALDWRGNQPSEPGLWSAIVPSAGSFLATPRSQSVPEDFALPKHCDDGGSHMRKSFIALALLVGAVAMLTTSGYGAGRHRGDQGVKLNNAKIAQMEVSRAARLRTSADSDTFFDRPHAPRALTCTRQPVRASGSPPTGRASAPTACGTSTTTTAATSTRCRAGSPIVRPNARTSGTLADICRPWMCLDWGNRLNATPVQGRTRRHHRRVARGRRQPGAGQRPGRLGLPHVDPARRQRVGVVRSARRQGRRGHRPGVARRHGQPDQRRRLWGEYWNATNYTAKLFPGYAHRWDQMLYRDVRVADGRLADGQLPVPDAHGPPARQHRRARAPAGSTWTR